MWAVSVMSGTRGPGRRRTVADGMTGSQSARTRAGVEQVDINIDINIVDMPTCLGRVLPVQVVCLRLRQGELRVGNHGGAALWWAHRVWVLNRPRAALRHLLKTCSVNA